MSSPVGSAYPGNLLTSVFACFFLIVSARSALSAYGQRNKNRKPQSREANIGVSIIALLASLFAFYAIWVHRGWPSLSRFLRRLGMFIRHSQERFYILSSSHALGTETLSTSAASALHHVLLLSSRSSFQYARSQKHIRKFAGTREAL